MPDYLRLRDVYEVAAAWRHTCAETALATFGGSRNGACRGAVVTVPIVCRSARMCISPHFHMRACVLCVYACVRERKRKKKKKARMREREEEGRKRGERKGRKKARKRERRKLLQPQTMYPKPEISTRLCVMKHVSEIRGIGCFKRISQSLCFINTMPVFPFSCGILQKNETMICDFICSRNDRC